MAVNWFEAVLRVWLPETRILGHVQVTNGLLRVSRRWLVVLTLVDRLAHHISVWSRLVERAITTMVAREPLTCC